MQQFNSRCADVEITVVRGDTWYWNFQVQDENGNGIDLSDYTSAKLQVRESEISIPVLTLSSSGNTIDISYLAAGQITISTPTSSVSAGQYYMDLELRNSTTVETIFSGIITFENDYTN